MNLFIVEFPNFPFLSISGPNIRLRILFQVPFFMNLLSLLIDPSFKTYDALNLTN